MSSNTYNFSFPPTPSFTPPPLPTQSFLNQELSWRTYKAAEPIFSPSLHDPKPFSNTGLFSIHRTDFYQNSAPSFRFHDGAFGTANARYNHATTTDLVPYSSGWSAPVFKQSSEFLPKLSLSIHFERFPSPHKPLYTYQERTFLSHLAQSPQFSDFRSPSFILPQFVPQLSLLHPSSQAPVPHELSRFNKPAFSNSVVMTAPPPSNSSVQISIIEEGKQPITDGSTNRLKTFTSSAISTIKVGLTYIGLEQFDLSPHERRQILSTYRDSLANPSASIPSKSSIQISVIEEEKQPTEKRLTPLLQNIEPTSGKNNPSLKTQGLTFYDFERVVQINALNPNLSRSYDLGRPELSKGAVGFINGIMNSLADAQKSSELISSYLGEFNVHSVYNAHIGFFKDITKVFLGMQDPSITRAVLEAHKTWDNFFATATSQERFLQFAHSGGATQCKLALESYSPELRKRIQVVAIAPATYIPDEICHSVVHFVSTRDFVPKFDQHGKDGLHYSVVLLEPHADVSTISKIIYQDHGIDSPTYQSVIEEIIKDYTKEAETW